MVVRRIPQRLDHLERHRLLPLQPVRVDRVHDVERERLRYLLHQAHALIEIATNLNHDGAMHHGLRKLPQRNLAFRDQHETRDFRARGVGRRGCRGIARRRTNDRSRALLDRAGHGHRHAAELYWKYSKESAGAVELAKNNVDGIVFISSFPCAPDSMVNELIIRKIKLPYLNIIIDDLNSLAGIETRIESFIDIIEQK